MTDVRFLGIASRDDLEPIRNFITNRGVGAFDHAVDEGGDVWSYYGVWTQPSFAFISAEGEVEVFLGAMGADGLRTVMGRHFDA